MAVRPRHEELPGLSVKVEDEKNDKKSVKQNNRWFLCTKDTISRSFTITDIMRVHITRALAKMALSHGRVRFQKQ